MNQLKPVSLQVFKASAIQPFTTICLTPSGSFIIDGRKDSYFINDVKNITTGSVQPVTLANIGVTGSQEGFTGSSIPIAVTGSTNYTSTGSTGVLITTGVGFARITSLTVDPGKTFFLTNVDLSADFTTLSATGALIGSGSLTGSTGGSPATNIILTQDFNNPTTEAIDFKQWSFNPPMKFTGSTGIALAASPAGATSTRWRGNIIGYES